MLYYDRIDISEGIDPAKCNSSKECMICNDLFYNHGFKFQDSVGSGCHDLTIFCLHVNDIALVLVKNFDYCCIIHGTFIHDYVHSKSVKMLSLHYHELLEK